MRAPRYNTKEIKRAKKMRAISGIKWSACFIALFLLFSVNTAYTLPEGWEAVEGTAEFDTSIPNQLTIRPSDNAVINYSSFNIAANESVYFYQASANSNVLNNVTGSQQSNIAGYLYANGNLFIVNPNGIVFDPRANINVGSLVAATMNIDPNDFKNGNFVFQRIDKDGQIINQAVIHVSDGGFIALLAQTIKNEGVLQADQGTVALAGGNKATLSFGDNKLIQVAVDEPVTSNPTQADAAILNTGTIQANSGKVIIAASAVREAFANAVNNEGIITAGKVVENEDGTIALLAPEGNIANSGTMYASGDITIKAEKGDIIELASASITTETGDITISSPTGDITLSNISSGGGLDISAPEGSITQLAGTKLAVLSSGDLMVDAPRLTLYDLEANTGRILVGSRITPIEIAGLPHYIHTQGDMEINTVVSDACITTLGTTHGDMLRYSTTGNVTLEATNGKVTNISDIAVPGNIVELIGNQIGSIEEPFIVNAEITHIYRNIGDIDVAAVIDLEGDRVTIVGPVEGFGAVTYCSLKSLTLEAQNGGVTDSGQAIIPASTLTLIGNNIGHNAAPVITSADTLHVRRTSKDIVIALSSIVGEGVTVRGPPDDNFAITYSKNSNLILESLSGGIFLFQDSAIEAENLALYAARNSSIGNLVIENTLILSSSREGSNPVYSLTGDVTVSNLTINNCILDGGNATITVSGNWSVEGGSFSASASTVILNDASKVSCITGSNTFYNLTIVTAGKAVVFEAGTMTTVSGTLTIEGADGNNVSLSSSETGEGNEFDIWVNAVRDSQGNDYCNYITVTDSDAYGPATPIPAHNDKIVGRNNTNWDATFTSTGNGDWNLGATWGNPGNNTPGSGYPDVNDTANIGHTVTITANQSVTTITITTGGNLIMNANLSSRTTFAIKNFTINSGGQLTQGDNTTLTWTGGGTTSIFRIDGTFTKGGGTAGVVFAGLGLSLYSNNQNLGDVTSTCANLRNYTAITVDSLTINTSSARFYVNFSAAPMTMTISSGGTITNNGDTSSFDSWSDPVTIEGLGASPIVMSGTEIYFRSAVTFKNVDHRIDMSLGNLQVVRIGDSNCIFQSITLASGSTFDATNNGAGNYNCSVTGNWTNDGGTFTPGTGTVTFKGTDDKAINGTAASQTFYNLIVNMTAGKILSVGGSTTTLTVQDLTETTGNFTAPATLNINGNCTLTAGTFTAGANTNISGSWTNNGATFTANSGTVTFNGNTGGNIKTNAQSFYILTINNPAGTGAWTLVTNNLTVTNNLNITKGTLNLSTLSLNANGGTTTIGGGALTGGSGSMTLKSLTINNVSGSMFTASQYVYMGADGAGAYTLNGTVAMTDWTTNTSTFNVETLSQTIPDDTYYNLNIDNIDSGTASYTLGTSSIAIQGYLRYGADFTCTLTVGTTTLNISGYLDIITHGIPNSAIFSANGTINIGGDFTNTDVFTANSSTVVLNGTGAQTVTSGNDPFYDLTINKTSGYVSLADTTTVSHNLLITNGTLDKNGQTLTVSGSFTYSYHLHESGVDMIYFSNYLIIDRASTFTAPASLIAVNAAVSIGALNLSGYDLTLSGSLVVGANTALGNGATFTAGSGTISLAGLTIQEGASESVTFTEGAGTINITGNMTVTGSPTFTKNASGKIVFKSGNANQQLTSGGVDIGNIQISANSGNTTLTLQDNLTADNITIDANQTLSTDDDGFDRDITCSGTWINDGTVFATGTTTFDGSSGSIEGSSDSMFYNLIVNTSGTVTANADITISHDLTVTGTFAIASEKTVTATATDAIVEVENSSYINGAGTFLFYNVLSPTITLNASGKFEPANVTFEIYNNGESSCTVPTIAYGGTGTFTLYAVTDYATDITTFTIGAGTFSVGGNFLILAVNYDTMGGYVVNVNNNATTMSVKGDWTSVVNAGAADADLYYVQSSGTTVILNGTGTQTINFVNESFYDLTINKTFGYVSIIDTITVSHNLLITNGTLDKNGYTLTVNGSFTYSYHLHESGVDMIYFSNYLIIDRASTFTAPASLSAANAAVTTGTLNLSSYDLTLSGSLVVGKNSGSGSAAFTAGSGTVSLAGLTIQEGASESVTFTEGAGTINITGNMTVTGSPTFTKNASGKIVFKSGNANQQLTSGGVDIGNIQISANSGNTTLTLQDNLNADNITIDANQTLSADDTEDDRNISCAGNWTNNGTFTAGANSVVTFDGSTDQTISGSSAHSFCFWTINKGGGQLILDANVALTGTASNFTLYIASVTTVNLQTYTLTFSGTSDADIYVSAPGTYFTSTNSNGKIIVLDDNSIVDEGVTGAYNFGNIQIGDGSHNPTLYLFDMGTGGSTFVFGDVNIAGSSAGLDSGSVAMTVSGNWTNNGVFTAGTGTVTFVGSSSSIGGSAVTTFYDLIVDTSGTVTANADIAVSHDLTIEAGTLNMSGYGFSVGSTTTIDPSGSSSGTLNSSQRRSFFDTANSKYWAFYYTGSAIEYAYSSDGNTWTTSATISYNTANFSIGYKNISGAGYAFVVADGGAGGYNVTITRGTCGATSITSWSADAIVFNGASSADSYSKPTIALDSSNYIWVGARHYEQSHYYQAYVARSTNVATGDLSAANWDRVSPVGGGVGGHSSTLDSLVLVPGVSRNMSLLAVGESNNITHYTFTNSTPLWAAANTGGDYAWLTFPYDDLSGVVHAMTVIGANIYVGGDFTTVGGLTVNRIAKYTPSTSTWYALGSTEGVNGSVRALAADGSDTLYVGGLFTQAGGIDVNYIAKYTISTDTWSALTGSSAGTGGDVYAIKVVDSTNVYVGGNFTTAGGGSANYIAKWSGSAWSALGTGMNQRVRSIEAISTTIYAGGDFTTAGGQSATYIAKWNGSAWSAVGTGTNGPVYAMAASGTNLYVGGNFATAGGTTVNNIAMWNGSTTWSALGSGTVAGQDGMVYSLAVVDASNIYVGGDFTTASGTTVNYIARWNGSSWAALNTGTVGTSARVRSLTVLSGNIYAGGEFTTAGGTTTNYISKYTPGANPPTTGTWTGLSTGTLGANNIVYALTVLGTDIYVGGSFTTVGGVTVNRIAKYTPSTDTWYALTYNGNIGVNNTVRALAVIDTDLYVGGYFTTAGGVTVNRIARWTGSAWEALNTGTPGVSGSGAFVMSLAVISEELYVGGYFTAAGGTTGFNRIAKYTPSNSTWSTLGTGMNDTGTYYVNALAVLGTDLYAGGKFTTAGGQSVSNIAKWSGSWSALGAGTDDIVNAIVADTTPNPDVIYVGGFFLTAGGTTVNYIAKYTPGTATWSALGTGNDIGVNSTVRALAVIGSNLYVGGDFTMSGNGSGTVTLNRAAKWTGSAWAATNTGDDIGMSSGSVYAMTVNGTELYAGGSFIRVKGLSSGYFAKYALVAAADTGTAPISVVSDIVGNIHYLYNHPSGYLAYGRFNVGTQTWGSAVTVYSGTVNSASLSISSSGNSLQAFWVSSNTIYSKSGAILASNTKWDATATSLYSTGTNTNVLSMYEVSSLKTPLLWTKQTGGTYDVTSALSTATQLDLSVSGDWSNSGTFNAGAGTVTLNGTAGQAVTTGGSSSAFTSLTITNIHGSGVTFSDALYTGALNAVQGSQNLYFVTTGTHTITDTFNVSGTGAGTRTTLDSIGSSGTWNLDAPTTTVSYLIVTNSIEAVGKTITATSSIGYNNTRWTVTP